jgi:hypothetical protein
MHRSRDDLLRQEMPTGGFMVAVNNNLYGCWKLTAVKFMNGEGAWEEEEVLGGTSIFTEGGIISTFTRTSDLAFGYSGNFALNGNDLEIKADVCSIPDLEGKTIIRTVKKLTEDELTLGLDDEATGRYYLMDFKLLTFTFGH